MGGGDRGRCLVSFFSETCELNMRANETGHRGYMALAVGGFPADGMPMKVRKRA